MPRNFRDAVYITRRLNLKYIWIDSLCIIQDSVEDWHREAAMMGKVYNHAYVTLAATCSGSSHEGFLERNLKREIRVPFHAADKQVSGLVYLRQVVKDGPCNYEENVLSSTWASRGWTLQEKLLARRVVHFCRDQTYFECRTQIWAEDNHQVAHVATPSTIAYGELSSETSSSHTEDQEDDSSNSAHDSSTEDVLQGHQKEGSRERTDSLAIGDEAADNDDNHTAETMDRIFERWLQIVAQYSRRNLTYGSDKLPALSGLARETSSAAPVGRYIAGIWEHDMIYELLWICSANDGEFSISPSYRAPSWSWAAMDGQITWVNDPRRQAMLLLFDLLDVNIELEGSDPYGRIKHGDLVVSGCFTTISIGNYDGRYWSCPYQLIYQGKVIGLLNLDSRQPLHVSTELYALQLIQQLPWPAEHGRSPSLCGLLLQRRAEQVNTFSRVGAFLLNEDSSNVFYSLDRHRLILV